MPAIVATLLLSVGGLMAAFYATGTESLLVIAGGFGSLLVLLAPQVRARAYDLFQPLTFIAWSVFIGMAARTLYVVTVDDATTRDYLLLGRPPEFLMNAAMLVIVALACFVAGYSATPPRVALTRWRLLRHHEWSPGRLALLVIVLVVIASTSTVLYLDRMGIEALGLTELSAKRRLVVQGAQYEFASLGYYLWGANLFVYAFYLLLTYVIVTKRRLMSWLGIATLCLGATATVLPIITSSRTEALIPVVYAALIWHYLRNSNKASSIALLLVAVLSGAIMLGSLRALNQGRVQAVGDHFGIEAILGTRHWLDVTKTAHILDAVPEREGYQFGSTLVSWVFAPIPRTLWLEKPIIRPGQIIGQVIYEGQFVKTGVPPGFIAELYWNFGYPGVVIGMFLFGVWLRFVYNTFRPHFRENRNALLLYVGIMIPFALMLLGSDLSGTVLRAGTYTITMVVLLSLVSSRRKAHPAATDDAAAG